MGNNISKSRKLLNLINAVNQINKSDIELLEKLLSHTNVESFEKIPLKELNKDKKELIGKLPFILMETKYFNSNQEIVSFAEKININIPTNWEKRSKEEIIGRIVVSVSKFEPNKLEKLNRILNEILGRVEQGVVSDFFLEWDRVIKKMK